MSKQNKKLVDELNEEIEADNESRRQEIIKDRLIEIHRIKRLLAQQEAQLEKMLAMDVGDLLAAHG